MSSILDALNKLEKEESRRDYPLKRARADRKEFTSKIAMGIIGVVCVCIMAVGFAAYNRRGTGKMPLPPLETTGPAVKAEMQKTPQPGTSDPEQETVPASLPKTLASSPSILPGPKTTATPTAGLQEAPSLEKKTETGSKSWETGKNNHGVETEQRQILKAVEESTEAAGGDTAPQDPEPRVVSGEKNSPPDATATVSKKAIAQEEKPLPINRLKGVSFKIQAISWGETPQERLVVISNQVLREGDSIEGYRISRINPDDIVLRRGNNAYRLDFGLKDRP